MVELEKWRIVSLTPRFGEVRVVQKVLIASAVYHTALAETAEAIGRIRIARRMGKTINVTLCGKQK